MKMKKEITIKIKLKRKFRKINIVVENEKDVEKFNTALLDEVVIFGPIIFLRSELKYAIVER